MRRQSRKTYLSMLTVIPASLLGITAMIWNDIASVIWLQNLISMIVCIIMAFVLLSIRLWISDRIIAFISLFLLILTFLGNGIDGVHRWINLGIINMNASMIVIPIMLVAIYRLLEDNKTKYALICLISAAVLLFLQPDASQLAGFSIPVIIFLFEKKIKDFIRYPVSIILIGLMIISWFFLDGLEPVSYVEGILELLNNKSWIWMTLGVVSLILIPLPYMLLPPARYRVLSICIGFYYGSIIISAIFGNFPVPIMGYGISSIIGYFIIWIWYTKVKQASK